jgi:hypothetical protein
VALGVSDLDLGLSVCNCVLVISISFPPSLRALVVSTILRCNINTNRKRSNMATTGPETKDASALTPSLKPHILKPNDIDVSVQTWKDSVAHNVGMGYGLVSHAFKTGERPPKPTDLMPMEPVKPTADILPLLVEERRAAHDATYADVEDADKPIFKEPTLLQLLREHQTATARYLTSKHEWESAFKIYQEFEKENKAAYSVARKYISDDTFERVTEDKEGKKAAKRSDTLKLLQIAEKLSLEIDSAIAEAAKMNAKSKLDTLTQDMQTVDTFLTKLNAAVKDLQKIDADYECSDSQRREYVFRGANERWKKWIGMRRMMGNLPGTYEELCSEMRKVESTNVYTYEAEVNLKKGEITRESSYATETVKGKVYCIICKKLGQAKRIWGSHHTEDCTADLKKPSKNESDSDSDEGTAAPALPKRKVKFSKAKKGQQKLASVNAVGISSDEEDSEEELFPMIFH